MRLRIGLLLVPPLFIACRGGVKARAGSAAAATPGATSAATPARLAGRIEYYKISDG